MARKLVGVVLWLALLASLLKNGLYPLLPVLGVAVLSLILLAGNLWQAKRDPKWQGLSLWLSLPLLVFVLWSWLSLAFSQTATVGFKEVLLDTVLVSLIVTLPYWLKRFAQNWAWWGLSICALINSGWAIGQYFYRTELRVAGLFYQPEIVAHYYPNAFALSCLLLLPVGFYFLFKRERYYWWWGVLVSATVGLSLILSWSRGGWLGGIGFVGLLVLGLVVRRYWSYLLRLCLVGLMIVLMVPIAQSIRLKQDLPTNTFISKAQFAGTESQTSVGERRDYMVGAFNFAKEQPVFGYGPGSFPFLYAGIQRDWLALSPHAHNWLLNLAMERGFITSGAWLGFWLLLLIQVIRKWPKDKQQEIGQYLLVIGILVAWGHNLIDFNFNFVFNVLVLAVLVSLLIVQGDLNKQKGISGGWLSATLLVWLIAVLLLDGPNIYEFKRAEALEPSAQIAVLSDLTPHFFVDEVYLRVAYWSEQTGDLPQAVSALTEHLDFNPYDAAAWNYKGELQLQTPLGSEFADSYFRQAIELDPKNHWLYYYNFLQSIAAVDVDLRQQLGDADVEQILAELKAYKPLVDANVHFAAQSKDFEYAQMVEQMLIRNLGIEPIFDGVDG